MADDPRDDTRQGIIGDWCPEYSEAGQRTLLAELDRADPLRALLADEDRAAIAAAAAFYRATSGRFWTDLTADDRRFYLALNGDGFRAVLAALREVADDQSPAGSRGYAAEARRG